MKTFNTTGICNPQKHYMVDITDRLQRIKRMVDDGDYFTINRSRQYGKTTTLVELGKLLSDIYSVISLDFQKMSQSGFETEEKFVQDFCKLLIKCVATGLIIPSAQKELLELMAQLRDGYISREKDEIRTFQSVILAGVTDVKHLKSKIRDEDQHKVNSPWNIAAEFQLI